MRRAVAALIVTVVVVVLLASFKTRVPSLRASALPRSGGGAASGAPSGGATASGSSGSSSGSSGARRSGRRRQSGSGSGSAASATRSAVGEAIQYQYGVVQVKATVRGGRLTGVQTVMLNPDGGHSQEIDAQAEPLLRQEALQAQSANIDVVSGATYTSDAYAQSLQSAIDRARGA